MRPLRLLLVARRHDDVRAGAGQRLGGLQAEAAVGAGDDGHLAVEVGDVRRGPGHDEFASLYE